MRQILTDKSDCKLKVRAKCYWLCAAQTAPWLAADDRMLKHREVGADVVPPVV